MKDIDFSNALEECRASIENYMYLYRLKDKYGNVWDIKKIEITHEYTILRLGLDGTENFSSILLKNPIYGDKDTDTLDDFQLVPKEDTQSKH